MSGAIEILARLITFVGAAVTDMGADVMMRLGEYAYILTKGMFAAIADRYDLNNRLHSLGRDQAWRKKAVKLAQAGPTDNVLDVACGTGDLTEAFARAGVRSATGVDFTPEMLEVARDVAGPKNPSKQI